MIIITFVKMDRAGNVIDWHMTPCVVERDTQNAVAQQLLPHMGVAFDPMNPDFDYPAVADAVRAIAHPYQDLHVAPAQTVRGTIAITNLRRETLHIFYQGS